VDTVGSANLKLSAVCVPGGVNGSLDLKYKEKPAGQISFMTEWIPAVIP
jgi:hypothetical protein